jgi:HD-GYP domain-containing protein (c-di-GMP phosphodiesterase class II)
VLRSRFSGGSALIDFRGPPGTIAQHSFVDVLRGRVARSAIAGKIVVVGASTPTLQDLHQTSTTSTTPMAGPELQANAIWTALHGNPLQPAPGWMAWLAIALAALLVPLLSLRLRVLASLLVGLAVATAYALLAQLAFDSGNVLVVTYPAIALATGCIAMLAAHYIGAFMERNSFLRQLQESQLEMIHRLVAAVEARDAETGGHVQRIGILCERLALELGWSPGDAEMLRHASAMHDIGKIGVPDRVLLKAGALDEEEWEIVRAHTTAGGEILADSANPHVRAAEHIARSHHERWDGTGYPEGLAGEQIPIEARICAVCDVYDALLSKRSYKESWQLDAVLAEIRRGTGTHFDPAVVDAFLRIAETLDDELERAHAPHRAASAAAAAAG